MGRKKFFDKMMAQNFQNLIKTLTYRFKKLKKLGENLYDLQLGSVLLDMAPSAFSFKKKKR